MKIQYHENPSKRIEYYFEHPSEVIAISNGLIYSFHAEKSKINRLEGTNAYELKVNPLEFEKLKKSASEFNFRKGKEITSKFKEELFK